MRAAFAQAGCGYVQAAFDLMELMKLPAFSGGYAAAGYPDACGF